MFLNNIIIARFPIDIFNGGFGFIFKMMVPLALIANPAAMALIGNVGWELGIISVFISIFFLNPIKDNLAIGIKIIFQHW
ncbi:hypothetical protein C6H68_25195 [Photorhabdus luminescens]|nr:hypothetical protein C6H68_25195 [Photorhabdus luminescens]